jgi:chromate reductase, NAD(P)H dehydrogenase (quinone)
MTHSFKSSGPRGNSFHSFWFLIVVKVVGVCGSLQRNSANAALLRAAKRLAPSDIHMTFFDGLGELPHFNRDLEIDQPPGAVGAWRALLGDVDVVVIASPEYAHSLPGSLKNALDWIVGSGELYGKPVGLMSAGTGGGINALQARNQTLRAQGARIVASLGVAGVRTKVGADGEIADAETLRSVRAFMATVAQTASDS